jgi:serine/threonine-protein kinase
MQDIPGFHQFRNIEPLLKGWSNDKKYYIETMDGACLLLRIAEIGEIDKKHAEYEFMNQVVGLGIPMSKPLEFGICNQGKNVYTLLTWCEGEDAESVLPKLPVSEQYLLGYRAGEILKKIHSMPAPLSQEEWGLRFNRKIDTRIARYKECGIRFEGDDKIIAYLQQNRSLLENRAQTYQHGDFHVGNLIISKDLQLSVIDFNRPDFGDPWEEFNRIVWSASVSPHFATGQINGYFFGTPPKEFFDYLLFYISANTISSIPWAIPYGKDEVENMKKQAEDVLKWYDYTKTNIPSWFIMNTQ